LDAFGEQPDTKSTAKHLEKIPHRDFLNNNREGDAEMKCSITKML
jgi:hypothetical protein